MHTTKSRLNRIAHVMAALLAVFAFGAVMASVAQAEETKGPSWSVEGKRLGAGETKGISAKAVGNQTLEAGGITITCTALEAKSGQISGTAENESGKNGGTLRYSGCTVAGNGTKCAVEGGAISTVNLRSELVEDAATKKVLLVDFLPATGKLFAEPKFVAETGGTCTFKFTKITGIDVLAQVLTDPGELSVELGGTPRGEAESWLLKVVPTQPSAFWLIKGGKGEEVKIPAEEKLQAFGGPATLKGTALILLANNKGESTKEKWSPLP